MGEAVGDSSVQATDRPDGVGSGPEEAIQPPPAPKELSLEELVAAAAKAPRLTPGDIIVDHGIPGLPPLKVVTRFSPDPWKFGLHYMLEVPRLVLEEVEDPEVKGRMVRKSPNADIIALAREVVVSPTWLHNEAAVARFKKTVSPEVFTGLRVDLEHAAGLKADFFVRFSLRTTPMSGLSSSASASASASANPPGRAPLDTAPNSSASPSTTVTGAPRGAESASPTTSGSSPSTPTTAPRALRRPPTQSSATSSKPSPTGPAPTANPAS
jgi:hypothetical protein